MSTNKEDMQTQILNSGTRKSSNTTSQTPITPSTSKTTTHTYPDSPTFFNHGGYQSNGLFGQFPIDNNGHYSPQPSPTHLQSDTFFVSWSSPEPNEFVYRQFKLPPGSPQSVSSDESNISTWNLTSDVLNKM